jgi:dTDP-4-amino-4,6-dideoxygalactose transaminase
MDRIMEIARRHGLRVVEDAAQGVNSFYRGRALGSIGDLGAYSFHETKNYICGEGGTVCINRPEMVDRAEIIRDKGTNRKQFFRGLVDKYTWVAVGSSYVPSEICSAFLYAQLEMLEEIADRRRAIYQYYFQSLAPLEAEGLLRLPCIPQACQSNYHMFYLILPNRQQRDDLLEHLRARDIYAVFHYVPLHSSPMGCSFGYKEGDLPITENLSGRLLRLPFFYEITEAEQMRVVQEVGAAVRSSAFRRHAAAVTDVGGAS